MIMRIKCARDSWRAFQSVAWGNRRIWRGHFCFFVLARRIFTPGMSSMRTADIRRDRFMARSRSIAILGGGLMGAGIAQVFASGGHSGTVFDPSKEVHNPLRPGVDALRRLYDLDESPAPAITVTDDLGEAVAGAEFVTEAAPEKLELKRALFAELVEQAPVTAILASNTSVIPIQRIANGLPTAERIGRTHWWNPAGLIPLVEVVQSAKTSMATVTATMELLASLGKAPAHVTKDVPGFV